MNRKKLLSLTIAASALILIVGIGARILLTIYTQGVFRKYTFRNDEPDIRTIWFKSYTEMEDPDGIEDSCVLNEVKDLLGNVSFEGVIYERSILRLEERNYSACSYVRMSLNSMRSS